MAKIRKKRNDRPNAVYRPMAIAALVASGVLQPLLLPVLAAGTSADTPISNTATATYKDDSGADFDATSNTVQIKVAPIAGITVKATGITDSNGGAIEQGDSLVYNFDVANIGNTTADIYIPKAPATSGLDPASVVVTYQIGAGSVTALPTDGIIKGVTADQVIKVFVTANVKTSGIVAGDPISVTLGNTGLNDNTAATQNILDAADGANPDEVRTVLTSPQTYTENKEASAAQSVGFATKVTPQAFALLKKTATSVPGASPAGNDDVITYNLNFSVLNSSPNGSYSPADLVGTTIKLEGSSATKILVSDAIPAGTALQTAPATVPGWTTVYSTDNVDTTIPIVSGDASALPAANWSATAPANLSTVKRVGFIANGASITAGSAAVDFPISVITSGLPVNGGKVDNIAQAFGQTSGDAANKVVVDESGDANPSNFEDNGNLGPNYDPANDTGKANSATQGLDTKIDPKGDNKGVGPKGEVTEVTITGTVASANDSIFNGPNGKADAVGPTDANDDFTNASTQPPAGQDPAVNIATTQTASFKNTVSNPSAVALADVTVQPLSPTQAENADNLAPTGQYGKDTDIPLLTQVKITELVGGLPTAKTATYEYRKSVANVYSFVLISGTPVNFGSLASSATANYKTEVTLPAGTVTPLTAVSIPMVAFPDDNPAVGVAGYTNELTNNITLDRVYTGYMKLVKEARILSADQNTLIQDWTSAGLLTTKAAPGQFIEYRIRYQNISTEANGSGNVILNAKNFKLIEDGVTLPNTWASVTSHQKNTTFNQGTVNYYTGANALIGTTDPADGSDVGKYENVVPLIAPAGQGVFQFRRVVK